MAGSIKWMIYQADDGKRYAVKIDESNGDLMDFDDVGGAAAGYDEILPRGFRMRKVNFLSADGKTRRSVAAGKNTADLYNGTSNSATFNGITYQVVSTSGERKPRPFALDTGLDDGTPG